MFLKIVASSTLAIALSVGFIQDSKAAVTKEDQALKITVGGYFKFMGGLVHRDKDHDFVRIYDANNNVISRTPYSRRKGDFLMDAKVYVRANAISSDDIKYGAEIRLDANPANPQTDDKPFTIKRIKNKTDISGVVAVKENVGKGNLVNADMAYVYISKDNVGSLRLGADDGAVNHGFYYAPNGFGTGGVDGLYQDFLGSELADSYIPMNSQRSLKVAYASPRYEGFQTRLSFTPTNARKGRHIKRNRVALTDPGTGKIGDENFENIVEYSIDYVNTFDGFGVSLSAAGAQGEALKYPGRRYNGLNSYGFGANLAYAGYTLGGSWVNNNRSGYFKGTPTAPRLANSRETGWSLGLQYEAGPVIVGTNYANLRTAADTTVPGKDKVSVISGGATYKVASGLSVYGEVTGAHRKIKRKLVNGRRVRAKHDNGTLGLIGTRIDW